MTDQSYATAHGSWIPKLAWHPTHATRCSHSPRSCDSEDQVQGWLLPVTFHRHHRTSCFTPVQQKSIGRNGYNWLFSCSQVCQERHLFRSRVVTWLHLPNVDSNLCLANGLFGFKSCILCLDPVGLSTYTSMQVHYPYEHAACHCSEQVPNACIQYLYRLEAQTPSACVQSYTSKNRHINHRVCPFPLHCIPLNSLEL